MAVNTSVALTANSSSPTVTATGYISVPTFSANTTTVTAMGYVSLTAFSANSISEAATGYISSPAFSVNSTSVAFQRPLLLNPAQSSLSLSGISVVAAITTMPCAQSSSKP
ncbi:hypothetical protein PC129_g17987 [Phytophthora cactorum]|uniref:Uncharacterized protein n=1 Tax=Phytophthora cactorum TaxID=29920 RepID=A0A329RAR0_9STRA|nr:hypothetical protein Pcac1_g25238 [Phytophthora cactorum]KAG2794930.1 hypothetical protein PC111_g22367 [Phytophthora cactorum]KAG2802347.1 hypothetical protein PC112_g19670 [Phytophthora cactorum]KAG2837417.1 hypothetical protein PC113_g19836 [Phytophthora cactorum]KAG2881133.1 hypothetical protein PC114_g21716 [Phytophthora cactorum]